MKALIFNSGLGSRLGELTANKPKAMIRLGNGETIFHRQLRILHACGIDDFVVTTGPYVEQLIEEASPFQEIGCTFEFVSNPVYNETNYIYSMWLAREYLCESDFLVLHGDLVFDVEYAQKVVDSDLLSLGSVNAELPLPEKDFKARVVGDELREISVEIFDDDCVAFQPFYRLSEEAMAIWLDAVGRFVDAGDVKAYAESAANTVFQEMHVSAFSYSGHFVEEVDTPEDLERVSAEIRLYDFAQQPVFRVDEDAVKLVDGFASASLRDALSIAGVLSSFGMRRPLVVTTSFFSSLGIAHSLDAMGLRYETFVDFEANPTYEDVSRAFSVYRKADCDSLLSVGGGSAIDIAKCVKQLLALPEGADGEALKSSALPYSIVPHVAYPTTAGTGSESTHFAVCYVGGAKISVANGCLQPDAVLLDSSSLSGLPDYQKKCTMLDALCQAVESYWSARSCSESRDYSKAAIPVIVNNASAYLAGDMDAAWEILLAANRAGKAINLTTTTAPHAMSYKLTSMYGISHGHAVAMCMPHCWRVLLERGGDEVGRRLQEIAILMTGDTSAHPEDGFAAFWQLFASLELDSTVLGASGDVEAVALSVNLQRLSNFPIPLSSQGIREIYERIIIE